jgi:hypothetical protein
MKYLLSILLFMMVLPGMGQAGTFSGRPKQDHPNNKPNNKFNGQRQAHMVDRLTRLKMAKTAFITKQLDLTSVQNEKFWPVFNQYQDELLKAQIEKRLNNSSDQANGTDQLLKEAAIEQKILDIRKHYLVEFQKMLPPEKVSMIYKSEKQFNDELIKRFKEGNEEANN